MNTITKFLKPASMILSFIFTIELVFGYTGAVITIKDTSIRGILFVLAFVSLYLYCLCYIIQHKLSIFGLKNKNGIFGSFKLIDWVFSVLVASTWVSLLIVPFIAGTSFSLAREEVFITACMLLLYFPIRFMIQWKELNFKKFEAVLYVFISLLSVSQIVLYVGQSVNSNFIAGYFEILHKILGEFFIAPVTVLGHGGYPRVMYSTSIYLLIGIYLVLKKLPHWKIYDYIVFALHITAILTTMTKSIWFGALIGIAVSTVFYMFRQIKAKNTKAAIQFMLILTGSFLLIISLNLTVFDGLVGIRFGNSFAVKPSDPSSGGEDVPGLEDLDQEGAVISNSIKIEQTRILLEKWMQRPILGFGYGSYAENCIRSETVIFSYEMQLPALIMKTGLVGISSWAIAIIGCVIFMIKSSKKNKTALYSWLFLLLAFGFCIQTNPLLLSFTGISMLLYVFLACFQQYHLSVQEKTEELPKLQA